MDKEKIEYTANDEMPNCGCCDHFDGSDGFKCEEWCGAEHAWFGYRRTEMEVQNNGRLY